MSSATTLMWEVEGNVFNTRAEAVAWCRRAKVPIRRIQFHFYKRGS